MRIYFSSKLPCVLRVGGAPAGYLGGNVLSAEIEGNIPAEFLPVDARLLPMSFVAGENFFKNPPACCDVLRCGCYDEIAAARFSPRETAFDATCQGRGAGMQATVFECGGTFLCLQDARGFDTFPLPRAGGYEIGEETVGGEPFLVVREQTCGYLAFFSAGRKRALEIYARRYSCADRLLTVQELSDIAGHTVNCLWRAENGNLISDEKKVSSREGFDPAALDPKILPFAFFQEIAAGGDFSPYLSPRLKEQSALLQDYLGDFYAALLPKDAFYRTYGNINAVGLAYRRTEHSSDVKFFAAQLDEGKIDNVSPVPAENTRRAEP